MEVFGYHDICEGQFIQSSLAPVLAWVKEDLGFQTNFLSSHSSKGDRILQLQNGAVWIFRCFFLMFFQGTTNSTPCTLLLPSSTLTYHKIVFPAGWKFRPVQKNLKIWNNFRRLHYTTRIWNGVAMSLSLMPCPTRVRLLHSFASNSSLRARRRSPASRQLHCYPLER